MKSFEYATPRTVDEAVEQLDDYLRDSPGAANTRRVEAMLRDLRAGITPADDLEGL